MFDRLTTGTAALLGLAIGVLLALPLFWIGVKTGVGALQHNAQSGFEPVAKRQNAMADEMLRFEKLLKTMGWKGYGRYKADFAKVERLRAMLTGHADFEDRMEISQDLERALLKAEMVSLKAAKDQAEIGKNPFVKEFFMTWSKLKRYLVDEEMNFAHAVRRYNHVLVTWPVPLVIGYRHVGAMMKALGRELASNLMAWIRQAGAWIKYSVLWAWDKVFHNAHPEPPAPIRRMKPAKDPLYKPFAEPYYIAQAPLPEEDYAEIQFDRETPSMADVEAGREAPVFENEYRQGYPIPVPTVQKTVTY